MALCPRRYVELFKNGHISENFIVKVSKATKVQFSADEKRTATCCTEHTWMCTCTRLSNGREIAGASW
jgi:hypothetical protein